MSFETEFKELFERYNVEMSNAGVQYLDENKQYSYVEFSYTNPDGAVGYLCVGRELDLTSLEYIGEK
jgi:hypothetical protein